MRLLSTLLLATGVAVLFSGCDQTKPAGTQSAAKTTASDHGHDHEPGHDHDHAGEAEHAGVTAGAAAPASAHSEVHGGHPLQIENASFSAEWKHYSDNHVIEFFVLDKAGKADMPIKADSITVRQTGVDNPEVFKLAAVEPDADGKTAHFRIDDRNLTTAMHLGVEVEFEFDGGKYTVKIPPHAKHDH